MSRAAVLVEPGKPLEIWEVATRPPRSREVRVGWHASGICHSDLTIAQGVLHIDTPAVLGHEGAGIVLEVGPDVSTLLPGDAVILIPTPACGDCFYCRKGSPMVCEVGGGRHLVGGLLDGRRGLVSGGAEVSQLCFSGTFIEETIAPEISLVRIDPSLPLHVACVIGCGLSTGYGAARYSGEVKQGDTVVVVGCGGVGLGAVQAARIAGAERVIAFDRVDAKLELAGKVGATDAIEGADPNSIIDHVRDLTAGYGADLVIDASGAEVLIPRLVDMARLGGRVVHVGIPSPDLKLELPVYSFILSARTIRGHIGRGAPPKEAIRHLVDLWQEGLLFVEELISEYIPMTDINGALGRLERGEVTRSVIRYV